MYCFQRFNCEVGSNVSGYPDQHLEFIYIPALLPCQSTVAALGRQGDWCYLNMISSLAGRLVLSYMLRISLQGTFWPLQFWSIFTDAGLHALRNKLTVNRLRLFSHWSYSFHRCSMLLSGIVTAFWYALRILSIFRCSSQVFVVLNIKGQKKKKVITNVIFVEMPKERKNAFLPQQ